MRMGLLYMPGSSFWGLWFFRLGGWRPYGKFQKRGRWVGRIWRMLLHWMIHKLNMMRGRGGFVAELCLPFRLLLISHSSFLSLFSRSDRYSQTIFLDFHVVDSPFYCYLSLIAFDLGYPAIGLPSLFPVFFKHRQIQSRSFLTSTPFCYASMPPYLAVFVSVYIK